jgi:primosomal protein N' (replication factor Y)
MEAYAEIIVNVPHRRVDRIFHYLIPAELRSEVQPGKKVQVSFGNRKVEGIIINITDNAPQIDLKSVEKVIDLPALPVDLLELARWIADTYICSYIDALNTVFPTKVLKRKRRKKGEKVITRTLPLNLMPAQEHAFQYITGELAKGKKKVVLLHGVTGSGKTEVYLQAIQENCAAGRQAIVLVPEIALTPQMETRFMARFGERVAVLHSRLSDGERSEAWRRMLEGEADVAVGARSAIFAPFKDIGLIIIDEEHEYSYKQEDNPKYHTRDVALQRAGQHGAVVVLGSATPSVESYYHGQQKEYALLRLPQRVERRSLPEIAIVDMREELKRKNRSVFSVSLRDAIAERIQRGEQTILLINRRGFATFVLCRDCGLVMRCPHCSVSLTYHASDNMLRCHYCLFRQQAPDICPACQSRHIRYFGAGTQKIEEELRGNFPAARVLRMDTDTTARKNSHQEILATFEQGDADILLGTQMIAKGLDYPNVSLVGIIAADTALNLPDFRAGERTFQLMTQAAGRAGRGDIPGQVIIQTYNPEHYSIQAVRDHNYEEFYRQEIVVRQELSYPPFHFLIKIVVSGEDEREVTQRLQGIMERARYHAEAGAIPVEFLGPAPAPLGRLKRQYRWQLFFKGPNKKLLHKLLTDTIDEKTFGSGGLSIDVDPVSML